MLKLGIMLIAAIGVCILLVLCQDAHDALTDLRQLEHKAVICNTRCEKYEGMLIFNYQTQHHTGYCICRKNLPPGQGDL